MLKPDDLRAALTAAIPALQTDPDRLQLYIDQGSVACTGAPGLSFEYRYTLTVLLLDFAGHPDAVFAPMLAWLARNQPDLLQAWYADRKGVPFEADILDPGKVDMQISLPLSESVGVTPREGGGFDLVHYPEPRVDSWTEFYAAAGIPVDDAEPRLLELYADGDLVVTVQTP